MHTRDKLNSKEKYKKISFRKRKLYIESLLSDYDIWDAEEIKRGLKDCDEIE